MHSSGGKGVMQPQKRQEGFGVGLIGNLGTYVPQGAHTGAHELQGSDDPIYVQQAVQLDVSGSPQIPINHPSCVSDGCMVERVNQTVRNSAESLRNSVELGVREKRFLAELVKQPSSVQADVSVEKSPFVSQNKPVCEGVSSGSSWDGSQIVNDVLSRFQSDVASMPGCVKSDDEFLSVTGSHVSDDMVDEVSLTTSERNELNMYREVLQNFQNLSLNPSQSGVGQSQQVGQVSQQFGGFQVPDLSGSLTGWRPLQQQPVLSNQLGFGSFSYPAQPVDPVQNVSIPFSHVQQSRGVGEGVGAGAGGVHQPSLAPRNVELQKPSVFSGRKADVDNFIFEIRQYCDSINLGGSNAVRFVASHFKGDALTWWRSLAKDGTRIFEEIDLEDLLVALKKQFSDIDEEMKLRDKILSIKQRGSVTDYVTEFKLLQLKLGGSRLADDVALHIFLVGLKSFSRQQVMLQHPETLEDAILLAERAEQSLYWQGGSRGQARTFYSERRQVDRSMLPNRVSQYSNSKYKGPAPMVLGNVSSNVGGHAVVTCFHCGKVGHYARFCPDNKRGFGGQKRGGYVQRGGQQKRSFGGSKHVHNVQQIASSSQPAYPPPPQQRPKQSKN